MRSTPLLIDAKPSEGYAVHVRFEDGLTADVDLSYLLDYGGEQFCAEGPNPPDPAGAKLDAAPRAKSN